jgi:predicted transcriptional regulator
MTASTLRLKRFKLELSQYQLSELAGVSRFNISQFELGHRNLTKDERGRIWSAIKKAESNVEPKSP